MNRYFVGIRPLAAKNPIAKSYIKYINAVHAIFVLETNNNYVVFEFTNTGYSVLVLNL